MKKKLQFFDPKLTEMDNMIQNNWDIIWDCGEMVFVKFGTPI
jgi:hypothetical protein